MKETYSAALNHVNSIYAAAMDALLNAQAQAHDMPITAYMKLSQQYNNMLVMQDEIEELMSWAEEEK